MKEGIAVILAGGMGTRLQPAVADVPKCMAPVAGKPFLHYLLRFLSGQGIQEVVLSLGHRHEQITDWCHRQVTKPRLRFVIESRPLGTGGALQFALQSITQKNVWVLNGDSYYDVDLASMESYHRQCQALLTLALKPMANFSRYGCVEIDAAGKITAFREKAFIAKGLINGGIYLVDREPFMNRNFPEAFSLEKDFLEKELGKSDFYGLVSDGYFIDIGIPGDYQRAQTEIPEHASY
jgi:D-glycero-alpha-D-manno-heptose 1-phosphate guanylyltransferase